MMDGEKRRREGKQRYFESSVVWGTIDRMCSMMCDYDICLH